MSLLILSFRPVLYAVCFLLGISPLLSSKSRRFGTLYRFHLQGQVDEEFFIHLTLKMGPVEGSETSAFIIQTPWNYLKENTLQGFTSLQKINLIIRLIDLDCDTHGKDKYIRRTS